MIWNEILNDVPKLAHGSHADLGPELCFMEMTAFLAGEKHTDHPECACPVLTEYGIRLNDSGQEFRDLLTPLVPMMIGTKNDELKEARRQHIVFGVAQRILPIALNGRVEQSLIDAILAARDYRSLNKACLEAKKEAKKAANAANAAAADAAAYAAATAAAAYAAYAAATAAATAAADAAEIRRVAVNLLKEAIELDPDLKPPQIDMAKVEALKELAI